MQHTETREQAREKLEAADLYEAQDQAEREQMIADAVELIGKEITDSLGRSWRVQGVNVKDGFPTISGPLFWDRPEAVSVA